MFFVTQAGAGNRNGSSWDNAFGEAEFCQNLNGSSVGDEFWVAAGRYRPSTTGDKTWYFVLDPGVSLYGGFAGTETSRSQRNWRTNVTVLTGDLDFNDTVDARGVTRKASTSMPPEAATVSGCYTPMAREECWTASPSRRGMR